jgi:branched-chain amino acid transport system substrate-binding protein
MTGELSRGGKDAWKGIQIAHEEKPSVLGKRIELILVDNKSGATETAQAFSQLINTQKVVAIIGAMSSNNTLAGIPIAEENKIPVITPLATNPLITQNKNFINRACFTDTFQGMAAAVFAHDRLHLQKVSIFTDVRQEYSIGLSKFFAIEFKKLGGRILILFYETGDEDFSGQINAAMNFGADAIYITGYYTEAALVEKQARDMGFKGIFLAGDGVEAPEIFEIGEEAVEGMYFTTHYHPYAATTETAREFLKKFEKKYKTVPTSPAALAYDSYMILIKAIEMARSFDPIKIAENIRKIKNFPGVTGTITIDSNGNAIKPVVIDRVENGTFQFVDLILPKR